MYLGGQPRPLGRASLGGQSGILLLGSWEKRTEELEAGGLGERETRREKKRCAPQGSGDSGREAWEMKLLSVVCLLLRLPSPHPLLTQLWDIGGQPRFRSMWERYCRGVSAIV